MALNLQTAFLSPPVAMAAFYLKGVSPPHVTLNQIFVGMLPFMGIQVVAHLPALHVPGHRHVAAHGVVSMNAPIPLRTLELAYGPQTAVVWMNRPGLRNALDPLMIGELDEVFRELGRDDAVRAVVLAGRGKAFCAGADLNHMRASAAASETDNLADAQALADLLRTVHDCPKPVIARVHGPCMAGGMGLAAACDIVAASRKAVFALSETRLGLIPATISPYVLRAIGERAARRWFLTGETLDAAEAAAPGLAHELCEAEELDPRINALLGAVSCWPRRTRWPSASA